MPLANDKLGPTDLEALLGALQQPGLLEAPVAVDIVAPLQAVGAPGATPLPNGPVSEPAASPPVAANSHMPEREAPVSPHQLSVPISGRVVQESVRVAVAKLDVLLAQAGELTVTHIRVRRRLAELVEMRESAERWRRVWRGARGLRSSRYRRYLTRTGTNMAEESGVLDDQSPLHRTQEISSVDVKALLNFFDTAEQHVQTLLEDLTTLTGKLHDDTAQLGHLTQAIADEVIAVRLLPISDIFGPLERLVRDIARDTAKEVRLMIHGGGAEIDRKILEGLRDPLMHMLRNAVDHGIESPAVRKATTKKPLVGTITLSAAARGGEIELVLEDDGAGLDPAQIRAAAIRKGLLTEQQAAAMSDSAAIELIFQPGFSTRSVVTTTSGRGVGMDVARENIQRLGGHITMSSVVGQGTRFTITIPLTLATTRAILIEQSGQFFALPSHMVEHVWRTRQTGINTVEGSHVVEIEGVAVPIVELADILERPRTAYDALSWRPYIVLRQARRRVALLTDQLMGEQEIVVKSLGWPLRSVRHVTGATLLGSGQLAFILNPGQLLKTGLKLAAAPSLGPGGHSIGEASLVTSSSRRLLVVEDSLTTRTLEVSILEAAGYTVVSAPDGMEALALLRSQHIDLVVSDIEMPRLDGFALASEMRRDEKLRHLPLILVTSLDSTEYRERGMTAGADAYVIKSSFDQGQLLDTVSRLL